MVSVRLGRKCGFFFFSIVNFVLGGFIENRGPLVKYLPKYLAVYRTNFYLGGQEIKN